MTRAQAVITSRKEVPSSGSNLQQISKEIGGRIPRVGNLIVKSKEREHNFGTLDGDRKDRHAESLVLGIGLPRRD
jgi:hypothetical protein